jgi:hypothetical protein
MSTGSRLPTTSLSVRSSGGSSPWRRATSERGLVATDSHSCSVSISLTPSSGVVQVSARDLRTSRTPWLGFSRSKHLILPSRWDRMHCAQDVDVDRSRGDLPRLGRVPGIQGHRSPAGAGLLGDLARGCSARRPCAVPGRGRTGGCVRRAGATQAVHRGALAAAARGGLPAAAAGLVPGLDRVVNHHAHPCAMQPARRARPHHAQRAVPGCSVHGAGAFTEVPRAAGSPISVRTVCQEQVQ